MSCLCSTMSGALLGGVSKELGWFGSIVYSWAGMTHPSTYMWPLLGAWPSHSVASDFTEGIRDPHGGSSFGLQVAALEGLGNPGIPWG